MAQSAKKSNASTILLVIGTILVIAVVTMFLLEYFAVTNFTNFVPFRVCGEGTTTDESTTPYVCNISS